MMRLWGHCLQTVIKLLAVELYQGFLGGSANDEIGGLFVACAVCLIYLNTIILEV